MLNTIIILIGKIIYLVSKNTNLGGGSTWPGHIALSIKKNFIKNVLLANPQLKIILIAGTNGKTTTAKMITTLLKSADKTFFQNNAGANLLNGIASSIIKNVDFAGKTKKEFAIFETDENTLSLTLEQINPYAIIILNLFRDQLDRYGELNSIAKKWKDALSSLPVNLNALPFIILNADDPIIAYLGLESRIMNYYATVPEGEHRILYFGLPESLMKQNKILHGADSMYCPKCGGKLVFTKVAYSHLGDWHCEKCSLKRPKSITKNSVNSPLPGLYNEYNTQSAATFGKILGLSDENINIYLKNIKPAFGRQETIEIDGKKVQIFLSKNPTSFNQSLETIINVISKCDTKKNDKKITVLFILNDRIPDGTDISWIWDTNLEQYYDQLKSIIVSGDRCYDMAIRVQYSQGISNFKFQISNKYQSSEFQIHENLKDAIGQGLELISNGETLYVLPTYSAMLEVRKILTGKKIL